MGRWLDKHGACNYAKASKRMIETWMREGLQYSKLPSGTVRIFSGDIDNYLRRFSVNAGPSDETKTAADTVMERL